MSCLLGFSFYLSLKSLIGLLTNSTSYCMHANVPESANEREGYAKKINPEKNKQKLSAHAKESKTAYWEFSQTSR